jgi:hypothetical protein
LYNPKAPAHPGGLRKWNLSLIKWTAAMRYSHTAVRRGTVWRCPSGEQERLVVGDCVAFEAGLGSAWHADEGGIANCDMLHDDAADNVCAVGLSFALEEEEIGF